MHSPGITQEPKVKDRERSQIDSVVSPRTNLSKALTYSPALRNADPQSRGEKALHRVGKPRNEAAGFSTLIEGVDDKLGNFYIKTL